MASIVDEGFVQSTEVEILSRGPAEQKKRQMENVRRFSNR